MKSLPAQRIQEALDGSLPQVAFVVGEEPLLRDRAVEALVQAGLGTGLADFNLDRFEGDNLDVDALLTARATLPMMAETRVVLVRHVERLHSARRRKLLDALVEPCDTCLVILVTTSLTPAESKRAAKIEGSLLVQAERPKERDAMRVLTESARNHGLVFSDEAAAALLATRRVKGGAYDLTGLTTELEKLSLYGDDRRDINADDVRAVVADAGESSIFELTDSIVAGDVGRALARLEHLYRQGDDPISVVTMTHRHFSLLWRTTLLQSSSNNDGQLARALGVPTFFVRRYRQQAGRINLQRLPFIFRELLEADIDLKSSAGSKEARLGRGRLLVTRIASAASNVNRSRVARVPARP